MKKLLALLLLFGIVGCSQSELERCVDANVRFKELTLDRFYVNDYDEIDLLPKSILDLNITLNNELEEDYKNAYIELGLKNYPATKQNADYLEFCKFDLDNSCNLDKEINQYNKVWSKPNQIATPTFVYPLNSDTDIRFFLRYYVRSESMVNLQKEFPNEPSTFWLDSELLANDYLIKSLDYIIEVNNIPKLIKDFNDNALKNNQLNATGICNAQGIY